MGTVLGGTLITPAVSQYLLALDLPLVDTATEISIFIVAIIYVTAAVFNLFIPNTGIDHRIPKKNPFYLIQEFAHCVKLLWTDKLGQISLAVTTLFWGAGATLQFIVIEWAGVALDFQLNKAAQLQGVVALGIAIGAVMAARMIALKQSLSVIPMGFATGLVVTIMVFVHDIWTAIFLLILIGGMAGFFVVPMNALLQHRGHILMGAGHSIAVQNFNENLSILAMLTIYALLIFFEVHIYVVIVLFGVFMTIIMALVRKWHNYNQSKEDSLHLIGSRKLDRRWRQ
jgi:hypothetical protein